MLKSFLKYVLAGAYFLFCHVTFPQTPLYLEVLDESGEPIPNTAIYLKIDSSGSLAFIGFTNELGIYIGKVPNNHSLIQLSCLGYKDTVINNLLEKVIFLETTSTKLREFSVIASKRITKKDAFTLIESALRNGAQFYGSQPKVYKIILEDEIQNFKTNTLSYQVQGYYLEDLYAFPKKNREVFTKDQWSMDWNIYSQNKSVDPEYYGMHFFPFVTYGFAHLFSPNPLNMKSIFISENFNEDNNVIQLDCDSGHIQYQINSNSENVIYILSFSPDSVLLELETFKTDTTSIHLPGKTMIQNAGFGSFKTSRKWYYKNEQYYLCKFTFNGYFFSEMSESNKSEFLVSEKMFFTPIDSVPEVEFKKIPIGIPLRY